MVAVPLIHGHLTAEDYEDNVASDPRIDRLRDKMICVEDRQFSGTSQSRQALDRQRDYHRVQDGSKLAEVVVEYPSVIAAGARKACLT
jgi:2-methylcitrate dehydratase